MNTSKIYLVACKSLVIVLTAFFFTNTSIAQESTASRLNFIYKPGDGGYACFRIPALITTSNNVILAFAEARKLNCGDAGDIDIVLRSSKDGGKSWSVLQVVRNDSTNTCGNPVPILDKTNGRILLVTSWNLGTDHEKEIMDLSSQKGRHVYVQHSDDEGKTWTSAKEITKSVKMANWTWYATGPCHGLQIANGQYKGRLVVPVNHVEMPAKKNFSNIIYSDDHGDTWKLGGNTPQDQMNETTVAEISKGRLMLNMRNADRTIHTRHTSISIDGGETWSDVRKDSTLVEPICQGSLLNSAIGKKPVLFFINPAHKTKRMNLTLRTSFDEGVSWATDKVIHAGPAAYSDITTYKNKELGILYEAGIEKPYEGIVFKLIINR
jgi:sialidase-1